MRWRLVASYLALVAAALVLFTVPVAVNSSALLRTTLEDTVEREARLFVPLVLRDDDAATTALRDRSRDFQEATSAAVRLVRPQDGTTGSEQVDRALAGRPSPPRWGDTESFGDAARGVPGTTAVSVVLPVVREGRVVAAVQIVAPGDEVEDRIRGIWTFRLLTGLGVLVLAAGVAVLLAGSIVRPLRRLDGVARRLGEGDFTARADESGPPEVAALTRTLNAGTARTQALLASQRSFVADASHQLRTPLTAVRLQLDNLGETADDPGLTAQLDLVDTEVRRLSRIVDGLLELARAEAPTGDAVRTDLRDVVTRRSAAWAAALADAGVDVDLDVPRHTVLVTPGALEQVLDNVVDNALAVSPPGARLWLRARSAGPWVELTVRDEGPGLPVADRERAFDRFWQARGRVGGTGLGLAVVRQLVERDGGTVTLAGPDGGGLEVVLRLRAPGGRSGALTRP